ncbi:helix-turn-helix domain-containing protein [Nonomuraea candida]|uniref:helix-turn-helix domain-containing protein n=1 Tax=Nonomuraea candida TaxID=359159 RepID=UPI000A047BA6|nr:helix-turn-helix domain-containing protein [Nonomuraea candida]
MDTLELLAHPVRLRVVHAMRGGRLLTTSQLAARIPDVSKATLYRHIDLLASEGVLEVADERRVRGAVERRYRLRQDLAVIDAAMLESLSRDDHRRGFATAMAILLAEFNAYLDRDDADPVADLVGYRQHALWLSPDELHELITELRAAIAPRLTNSFAPGRTQYLLSPILFPTETPPPSPTTDHDPEQDQERDIGRATSTSGGLGNAIGPADSSSTESNSRISEHSDADAGNPNCSGSGAAAGPAEPSSGTSANSVSDTHSGSDTHGSSGISNGNSADADSGSGTDSGYSSDDDGDARR